MKIRMPQMWHSTVRAAVLGSVLAGCVHAYGKDKSDDDGDDNGKDTTPTIYLDLKTTYTTIPAGSLPIGLGHAAPFTTLLALAPGGVLPPLPTSLSLPASQSLSVDAPLTIDLGERVSLYGGVSGSSTNTGGTGWSSFEITSWNIGLQADVYEQKGGSIPTITLQTTITQSIPSGPLATTAFTNIVEFDYAFDKDETRGLLAGVQYTHIDIGTDLIRISDSTIGYVGGYYQWPNNWKVTARAGMQSLGDARLLNLTPIQPFTQPVVRLDLDRMDDNDNRLFGVTAQVMWVPQPSYQLTLRTPLYAVRN